MNNALLGKSKGKYSNVTSLNLLDADLVRIELGIVTRKI
mgnify:CR=1 FL=1